MKIWNENKASIIIIFRFFVGICITVTLHASFELTIYTITALMVITCLHIAYILFYDLDTPKEEHQKKKFDTFLDTYPNLIEKLIFFLKEGTYKYFLIERKKDRKRYPSIYRDRGKYNPFFDRTSYFFGLCIIFGLIVLAPSILIYYGYALTILREIFIIVGAIIGLVILGFNLVAHLVAEYFFHISVIVIIILLLILISKKR